MNKLFSKSHVMQILGFLLMIIGVNFFIYYPTLALIMIIMAIMMFLE